MNPQQSATLNELLKLNIGSDDDALTFSARLSRENGWSEQYAGRCIFEYKRFLFLSTLSSEAITPSDSIDQVWHLHLSYTRSYWLDLCENILAAPLHHEPTQGGRSESIKFRVQYEATLNQYLVAFGESPPADIWPGTEERFKHAGTFIRLNKAKHWVIRKPPELLLPLIAIPLVLVACSDAESVDLWFYVKAGVAAYAVYLVIRWLDGRGGGRGNGGGGGCSTSCGSCGGD
ncbi:MAG: hypothetical protein COB51_04880 [Moraxellaceae bacterium]|nr:MAG: hypothetical protein COB51_04880 [Moraxellaceae bacterium]